MNCIICGGDNDGNHHCPPETIKRIETARNGYWDREPRISNPDHYGTRICEGFNLLNGRLR